MAGGNVSCDAEQARPDDDDDNDDDVGNINGIIVNDRKQ